MKLNEMTKEQAKEIIRDYDQGGHFKHNLLNACYHADMLNLTLIYQGYPELAVAMCIHHGLEYRATNSQLYIQ